MWITFRNLRKSFGSWILGMGKRKLSKVAKNVVKAVLEESVAAIPMNATTTATASSRRCSWVENSCKLYQDYHDESESPTSFFPFTYSPLKSREWGKPCHDERVLFEMLNLEGAQAGLSWETILKKRENYRLAFDNWDAEIISKYDQTKVQELLQNPGIVRNRLKVNAVVTNAQAYLKLREEFGGLDNYLWSQVPGRSPIISNGRERIITSPLSDSISKDLKKRKFKFVGSTIIYAYLQAVGLVNDHDHLCDWRNCDNE